MYVFPDDLKYYDNPYNFFYHKFGTWDPERDAPIVEGLGNGGVMQQEDVEAIEEIPFEAAGQDEVVFEGFYPMAMPANQVQQVHAPEVEVIGNQAEPMIDQAQQFQVQQQFHQKDVILDKPLIDQNQQVFQQLQNPEVDVIVNKAEPMEEKTTRFAELPADQVAKMLNYAVPTDHQVQQYQEHLDFLVRDYEPNRKNGSDPSFHRPHITYHGICALAIWNSPAGYVTSMDVYEFCMFHFPYFRISSAHFKSSIRHALYRRHELFTAYQYVHDGKEHVVFGFAPNVPSDKLLGAADKKYMENLDPRGHGYYTPILQCQDMFLWIRPEEVHSSKGIRRRTRIANN